MSGKAPKGASDLVLAEEHHQYVTVHGRRPAPGVTSVIQLLDKPALRWSASAIGASTALRHRDDVAAIARTHLESLLWKDDGKANYYGRKKLPAIVPSLNIWRQIGPAVDPLSREEAEALYVHWCRGEFQRQWDEKADLGNRVHDMALAWSQGNDVEASADEDPYLDALEKLYRDCAPRFFFCERVVLHPHPDHDPSLEYGGRFDAIVVFTKGELAGLTLLIDYKTGGEYLESTALQAAAYSHAYGMARYDDAGALVGYDPLPPLDGVRIVYLQPDGEYHLSNPFEELDIHETFEHFLELRSTLNFVRRVESITKAKEKSAA